MAVPEIAQRGAADGAIVAGADPAAPAGAAAAIAAAPPHAQRGMLIELLRQQMNHTADVPNVDPFVREFDFIPTDALAAFGRRPDVLAQAFRDWQATGDPASISRVLHRAVVSILGREVPLGTNYAQPPAGQSGQLDPQQVAPAVPAPAGGAPAAPQVQGPQPAAQQAPPAVPVAGVGAAAPQPQGQQVRVGRRRGRVVAGGGVQAIAYGGGSGALRAASASQAIQAEGGGARRKYGLGRAVGKEFAE